VDKKLESPVTVEMNKVPLKRTR